MPILDLAPPNVVWGAFGGGEFSNPGLGGPLSCLLNNNNANWRSEPPPSLLEGPESVSCIGVPPKGENPNPRPGAAPPRVPMGVDKWTSSVVTGEITWSRYSAMTS